MVFCLFVVVCFVICFAVVVLFVFVSEEKEGAIDLFHIQLSPGMYWRGLKSQEVVGGGGGTIPSATLSPATRFRVPLAVRAKQQDDVHKRKPLKREAQLKRPEPNRGPSAYQLNALPPVH